MSPQIELLAESDRSMSTPLHPRLGITGAEVRWACRCEMARTVDDVLARRTRSLLFDARVAVEVTPHVAAIMAAELGRDDAWIASQVQEFTEIASRYIYQG